MFTTTVCRRSYSYKLKTFLLFQHSFKIRIDFHSNFVYALRYNIWSYTYLSVIRLVTTAPSFGRLGQNFKNEAHVMASCTMPSCHRNAANTARRLSAMEGLNAVFTVCLKFVLFFNKLAISLSLRRKIFKVLFVNDIFYCCLRRYLFQYFAAFVQSPLCHWHKLI